MNETVFDYFLDTFHIYHVKFSKISLSICDNAVNKILFLIKKKSISAMTSSQNIESYD